MKTTQIPIRYLRTKVHNVAKRHYDKQKGGLHMLTLFHLFDFLFKIQATVGKNCLHALKGQDQSHSHK